MIGLGADHGGYKLKEEIKKYFDEKSMENYSPSFDVCNFDCNLAGENVSICKQYIGEYCTEEG